MMLQKNNLFYNVIQIIFSQSFCGKCIYRYRRVPWVYVCICVAMYLYALQRFLQGGRVNTATESLNPSCDRISLLVW